MAVPPIQVIQPSGFKALETALGGDWQAVDPPCSYLDGPPTAATRSRRRKSDSCW